MGEEKEITYEPTIGPWWIDGYEPVTGGAVVAEVPTAFGGYTIRTGGPESSRLSVKQIEAECLANAYLIAAAPDMRDVILKIRNADPKQFSGANQFQAWVRMITEPVLAKSGARP